ncbi:MAG: AAA family ATPase [Bacteroidales bacterium]
MKKAEKSAKTKTSKTNKNANPQVSKKTNKTNKEVTDEVMATDVKVYSKNAFQSSIAEEFEKFKKKIERDNSIKEEPEEDCIIVSGEQLLNDDIKEIPMLIPPLFHRIGIALFIGSSDIGKSTLMRQLCISDVAEIDFCGMKVYPKYHRAIICSGEDDEISISSLLKKQNKDFHLKPEQLANLIFIFDTYNLVERLEEELQKNRVDVIVIDPFTDMFSSDLYKAVDVRLYLNQFSRLARIYECLIIFLHHTRKGAENFTPSKNNALGSQSIEAKVRLALEFKANLNNPTLRHLCPVKGNYIPSEMKRSSIDLIFTDNLTFKPAGTTTPFDKINTNEVNLSTLEAEYKEIISLKEQGLNYREIGVKFGVSHSTIISRMKRYEKIKNSETIVKD